MVTYSLLNILTRTNIIFIGGFRIYNVNIKHKTKKAPISQGFVENTGIEPVTSCLPGKRSSQMS